MDINLTYIVVVLVVIFISMTLHEVMHGYMAYWLGDDTAKSSGRLTLNPISHIDPFLTIILPILLAISGAPVFGGAKPVPFNPSRVRFGELGAALVGLAGPLTNFVIAFILFGLYVALGNPDPDQLLGMILRTGIFVNLGFFIFNMIPIPPLDGSRVLYAIAPDWARQGMEIIERYGILIVFAVVMLFSEQIGTFMMVFLEAILKGFSWVFGV
ncbi:site-2 protease family protein [Candidatus Saccharibacteria bacterium]|nr:site-2 protease family protein [Candidatus Saccharibacteria bacterium]NCU40367.1 site-2 protease family protein [Candidatus Saccharibacteria bacterium]